MDRRLARLPGGALVRLADGHVHLFRTGFTGRYGRPASGGNDYKIYESLRRVHSIDLALLVGYEGRPQYAGNNNYIARLAQSRRWIAPVAFTLPNSPIIFRSPFVGISLYLTDKRAASSIGRWPERIFEQLTTTHAVVSINATPEALDVARDVIEGLHGAQVLISHLGLPGIFPHAPTRTEARMALGPLLSLAGATHVSVKLSGLYALTRPMHSYPHTAVGPIISRVTESFGPARLVWGSDFSPALDYVSFSQTVDAIENLPWSDSDRRQVMGGNLRRIIGIARKSA